MSYSGFPNNKTFSRMSFIGKNFLYIYFRLSIFFTFENIFSNFFTVNSVQQKLQIKIVRYFVTIDVICQHINIIGTHIVNLKPQINGIYHKIIILMCFKWKVIFTVNSNIHQYIVHGRWGICFVILKLAIVESQLRKNRLM